jgi:hypothetical protein
VLGEARSHPELVDIAVNALIAATFTGFAGWLQEQRISTRSEPKLSRWSEWAHCSRSDCCACSSAATRIAVDADLFVDIWVQMIQSQIGCSYVKSRRVGERIRPADPRTQEKAGIA